MPSIKEKRKFLRWVVDAVRLKKGNARSFLDWLADHGDQVARLRFIDEGVQFCPTGLVISASGQPSFGFKLHHKEREYSTVNINEAVSWLRNNTDTEIFIQINFPEKYRIKEAIAVMEQNPHIPESESSENRFKRVAEKVAETSLNVFHTKAIREEIDKALDKGDKAKFEELTAELVKLEKAISESKEEPTEAVVKLEACNLGEILGMEAEESRED